MRSLFAFAKKISLGYSEDHRTDEFANNLIDTADECCVALITVETGDSNQDCLQMVNFIKNSALEMGTHKVMIIPFSHLSPFAINSKILIEEILSNIVSVLKQDNLIIYPIAPFAKNLLLAEFLFFDGVGTTRLRLSKNSLKNELGALIKVFGRKLILNLLSEEL